MLVAGAAPGGDPTNKGWTKAGVEGGWVRRMRCGRHGHWVGIGGGAVEVPWTGCWMALLLMTARLFSGRLVSPFPLRNGQNMCRNRFWEDFDRAQGLGAMNQNL